jgi:hypothetical protein
MMPFFALQAPASFVKRLTGKTSRGSGRGIPEKPTGKSSMERFASYDVRF